jgi:hypothetical protein
MKDVAKALGWALVAVVCGFIAGILLSEVIGIVGYLAFHTLVGIKFLPVYLAAASGALALILLLRSRRRA